MSARYSSSPTLHLAIADSRQYRCLLVALALAALSSLFLLYLRGYPELVPALLPLAAYSLRRLDDQVPRECFLYWRQGTWWLERDKVTSQVEVHPRSACLPWVTCLVYTPVPRGHSRRVWIFADSCDRQSLRRLRVRLTLQR